MDLYFNLSEAQKELVYNRDTLLNLKDNINQSYYVASVQKLINAIESASNKEEARLIAKMAYDCLSEESKALITNAEILNTSFATEDDGCNGSVGGTVLSLLILGSCVFVIRRKKEVL